MTTLPTREADFQATAKRNVPISKQNAVQKSSVWYAFFTAISLGIGTIIFLSQLLITPAVAPSYAQTLALLVIFSITTVLSSLCASTTIFKDIQLRSIILYACIIIAAFGISAFIVNMGIPVALIALLASVIIIFALLPRGQGDVLVSVLLGLAVVISLINIYSPFTQIKIPLVEIYIISLLAILIVTYVVLLSKGLISATLRITLISTILSIVLISIIVLSFIQNRYTQAALQNQVNQSLKQAASNTASRVDEFFQTNYYTVGVDASLPIFSDYLTKSKNQPPSDQDILNIRNEINILTKSRQLRFLVSYGLINVAGKNIFDTNPAYYSKNENESEYFAYSMTTGRPFSGNVEFGPDDKPLIFFSSPIRDQSQQIIGILRVAYDAHILQQLLKENSSSLGLRSYPALYDENLIRVADAITPENLYKSVIPLSSQTRDALIASGRLPSQSDETLSTNLPDLAENLQNYLNQPFFTSVVIPSSSESASEVAAVVPLNLKPWILAYYEDQAIIAKTIEQQTRATILIATLLAGFVCILATITARILSAPILSLTDTVEKIAGGELNVKVKVESSNEIGTLATSFNFMTDQLSTLVNELEQRVLARTRQLGEQNEVLQYRSRQLETISDVANSITSTQDLETLLNNVTSLISERFGFYHVGVFLLDQNGEFAILRSTNSAGGKRMLARRHKLSVGQIGIVGYVTGKGIPRIATDVGKDAVFFNNPDLPETRSEMALPLMAGEKIIGALDVQSKESNAFSQSEIELFTILADQIAIAIVNNRLYEDTAQALVEMQNLHRQYMRQEWGKETSERDRVGYLYTPQGIVKQKIPINSPDIQDVLETSRIVVRTDQSEGLSTSMAVPIILRGETIGVIQLQESGTVREWSDDEIATVQSVAEQVALALENARLFEQTVRRAERERKVLEITSKIRSTTDPQAMLRIALEELQSALNASRTQIVLQQTTTTPDAVTPGNNGHNRT